MLCLFEREKEGYKERLSACMNESGHCSRKSDLNPGHPENIYATVVLQTVCRHQNDSSGLYFYVAVFIFPKYIQNLKSVLLT